MASKLKLSMLLIGIVSSTFVNAEDFAMTDKMSNVENMQNSNVVISAKVAPKQFYSILDNNGKKVSRCKSDDNGILMLSVSESILSGAKSLLLKDDFNNVLSEQEYYQNNYVAFNLEHDNYLMGMEDDLVNKDFFQLLLYMSVGDPISSLALGMAVVFNMFGDSDNTAQRLDELMDKLNQIQAQIEVGFLKINDRFKDVFKHYVESAMFDQKKNASSLRNKLITINNIVASSKYDNFRKNAINKYKDFKNKNTVELEKLSSEFWLDLLEYENANNIKGVDSVTASLEDYYKDLRDVPFYSFDMQKSYLSSLNADINKLKSQDDSKTFVAKINKDTLGVDLNGNLNNFSVCDGNSASMMYSGYSNTLLNLSNLRTLQSIVIGSNKIGLYKDLAEMRQAYEQELKNVNNQAQTSMNSCEFFGNPNGSSWPDITYVPIIKGVKSFLMVIAPIKSIVDLPQAWYLAYDGSVGASNERKRLLTEPQRKFFDILLNNYWIKDDKESRKTRYTADKQFLVAYYPLKTMLNIDNSLLFGGNNTKKKEKISKRCSYNKCVFDIEVPSDGYSIQFSDSSKQSLPKGVSSVTHYFPVENWDVTSKNVSYTLVNVDKEVEHENLVLRMPEVPQYVLSEKEFTSEGSRVPSYLSLDYFKDLKGFSLNDNRSTVTYYFVYGVKQDPVTRYSYERGGSYVHFDYYHDSWRRPDYEIFSIYVKNASVEQVVEVKRQHGYDTVQRWSTPKILNYSV